MYSYWINQDKQRRNMGSINILFVWSHTSLKLFRGWMPSIDFAVKFTVHLGLGSIIFSYWLQKESLLSNKGLSKLTDRIANTLATYWPETETNVIKLISKNKEMFSTITRIMHQLQLPHNLIIAHYRHTIFLQLITT